MNETRKMTGKRLLSLWLCLVMVLQWVAPVVSLAADAPTITVAVVLNGDGNDLDKALLKDASESTSFTTSYIGDSWFLTEPSVDPTVSGTTHSYKFKGWVKDNNINSDGFEYTSALSGDTTIYALWAQVYDVTFDANGGSGGTTTKQVIEHNDTIADVGTLTRADHQFGGWFTNSGTEYTLGTSGTKVTQDVALTAKWTAEYTVTFDPNDGLFYEGTVYQHGNLYPVEGILSGDSVLEGDIPTKITRDGYDFGGWYYDVGGVATPFNSSVVITGDLTVTARWTAEQYTVTFDLNGGKIGSSTSDVVVSGFEKGDTFSSAGEDLPDYPERTGYTFVNWYYDDDGVETVFDDSVAITGDLTVTAKWSYEVTFVIHAGDNAGAGDTLSITFADGDDTTMDTALGKVTIPDAATGFEFDGWYTDYNEITKVYTGLIDDPTKEDIKNGDETYYAKWVQVFTVTFDLGTGGTYTDSEGTVHTDTYKVQVRSGSTVEEPDSSKLYKLNSAFNDWTVVIYSQDVSWNFDEYTVKEDTTITVKWDTAIEVKFSVKSGLTNYVYPISVKDDASMSDLKAAIDARITVDYGEGYGVETWYDTGYTTGNVELFLGDSVTDSAGKTYYGTVSYIGGAATVTVVFNSMEGSAVDNKTVTKDTVMTAPSDPTRTGYVFAGWYTGTAYSDLWNFSDVVSNSMELYAKWLKEYTVTFDSKDGSAVPNQTVAETKLVTKPTNPTNGDFRFVGWYDVKTEKEYDFDTPVTGDVDLYAVWEFVTYYTVTFNANGGTFSDNTTANKEIRVEDGEVIDGVPTGLTRTSKGFDGWSTVKDDETKPWDATEPVTGNIEVFAIWSDKFTYTVKFDGNGKQIDIAAEVFTENSDTLLVTRPTDPVATAAEFVKWTTDAAGTTEWNFETDKVTSDVILYAQWETTYKVTFVPNGGTMSGYTTYKAEGSLIDEPEITLKGFILTGWYHRQGTANADTDPEWDFATDKVAKSAITLYAVWEKDPNDPLTSIDVRTTPIQLTYSEGDYFSPLGLVLTLNYKISDSVDLVYSSDGGFTFSPTLDTRLTLGTTKVTVYYGDEAVDIDIVVKESTRYVTGLVVDTSGTVQSEVNVYLQQNGVNVTNYQYRTDETGAYSFEVNDLPPGYYTIYCYQTVNPGFRTRSVVEYIDGYNQTLDNIVMPDGMVSSSVNNNSSLTVVNVPNLDALADELANGEDVQNSVRVAVNVSEATDSTDKAYINAYKTHGETIGQFFDLSLTKYLTYNNSSTSVTVPITTIKDTIVQITIELPEDLQNKGSYFVYRMHDGAMDKLETRANVDSEKIVVGATTITLHVNKFSTYAIAYTEQITSGDANTGDSELDGDRFTVTSRKVVNGEEVDDGYVGGTFYLSNNYPVEGTTVYLYPTANLGYIIDYVVAVNENGIEVKMLDSSEGNYYFIQGGSPVTLTVAFRSLPIPVSPEGYQGFYDVNEYDWFYDQVLKAAHLGYMVGVDYGVFSPNTGTTRGQIVQILYNLEGKPGASTFSGFPDVYAYDYFAQAVTWAKEVGAVAGYDDGYFRPNQEITREEMAVIFFRYAELSVNVTPVMWPFTVEYGDDFAISTWAKQSVVWCTNKGLFTGKNANLFAPKDIATRAEVATCVLALMDQQVEKVETIF